MPKRTQPRDFYTDWKLWEMDGKLHVQLTGGGWMQASARSKEAQRLTAGVLERAIARARRNRRNAKEARRVSDRET
jgi:hypothetical protein